MQPLRQPATPENTFFLLDMALRMTPQIFLLVFWYWFYFLFRGIGYFFFREDLKLIESRIGKIRCDSARKYISYNKRVASTPSPTLVKHQIPINWDLMPNIDNKHLKFMNNQC